MTIQQLITLIGAAGLGSSLTFLLQYYLSGKRSVNDRIYEDRKQLYMSYLEAWGNIAEDPDNDIAGKYQIALIVEKIRILGSKKVNDRMHEMNKASMGTREEPFNRLIEAMREDLK